MCLMGKISVLDNLHSCMSYIVSSILMNQQYILNKVSLNRNIHKRKLCINAVIKVL